MIYKLNEKLPTDNGEGIWLDYKDHTWLFFIKEDIWDEQEILRCRRARAFLRFVQKDTVDLFLLAIDDCLETSDLPFCIKEAEDDVLNDLDSEKPFAVMIIALDPDNTIKTIRTARLSGQNSMLLRKGLKERLAQNYDVSDFDRDYAKITSAYEPYELEPFAVFKEELK